jgi:hypothetical protein
MLGQISLQISIFEILSCVLSCFHDFSANSFLRFHFVFQKTVLFRTLLITIYQLILIYITCTYIFGLLFLLENEKKLIFVDFSLLSQPNSQHRGILSLIIYQLLCIMIMYGRWTNKTGTLKI